MDIDVLDLADQVAQGVVTSPSTVADGCIGASKSDLDQDDVGGYGHPIVLDAPVSKSLVRSCTTDSHQEVAVSKGGTIHNLDGL